MVKSARLDIKKKIATPGRGIFGQFLPRGLCLRWWIPLVLAGVAVYK
jgi:hypothetical protein